MPHRASSLSEIKPMNSFCGMLKSCSCESERRLRDVRPLKAPGGNAVIAVPDICRLINAAIPVNIPLGSTEILSGPMTERLLRAVRPVTLGKVASNELLETDRYVRDVRKEKVVGEKLTRALPPRSKYCNNVS